MPDIYVALSVIWALAVIHRYKYKSDKRHTLGNASGSYFWKALELNPSLKAFGHWLPVEFAVPIEQEAKQAGTELKVYIWLPITLWFTSTISR